MISFLHPEAFWSVPLLLLCAWKYPQWGLKQPLRVLVLITWMLAWAQPVVNLVQPGVDVWVLWDRSDSVRLSSDQNDREMESLLRQGKGDADRLFFVDLAEEVFLRDPLAPDVLTGKTDATRLGRALQFVLSLREPGRAARMLYLGDGFATDPLDRAGERLLAERVPLDVRLRTPDVESDVAVTEIKAPVRVRPGEPFLIDARISGAPGTPVEVKLSRDGELLHRQHLQLRRSGESLRWVAELTRPGASRYSVEVSSETDTLPGNNRRQLWVEAGNGNRVLLLSPYAEDPIALFLEREGLQVEKIQDPGELNPGSLSSAGAVWIHNVHASEIPREIQKALHFYVREQGGGLVMVGGNASFGAGGYHESPVDDLLPVSMELKEEDRKLSIALGVVLDRSGSMSAGAGGGRSKMDLANAGAARAMELLGDSDTVTVLAVDTVAHTVVPLSRVGENRGRLAGMVRRIQSSGGGIYVFAGLNAVWKELKDAPQPQRHVILFADAADAEQPEGVGELIREMRENQTTVSVIGLGSETDPDAPFLEQIAVDGGGRLFFNADASTLPAVFAQETVRVARSAFLEERTGTEALPGWREVAAASLSWLEEVDGYNLNYLKPDASCSLRSTDEYAAPLVAHWQQGMGRTAAISMPLGGPFSQAQRDWPGLGDLVRTLNRWLLRDEWPVGLHLRTERIGDTVRTVLIADEEWQKRFASVPPRLRTTADGSSAVQEPGWRRMEPGVLETDLDMTGISRLRGAVQIGNRAFPFGPVSGQPGSEWEFRRESVDMLRNLSASSGGRELTSLSEVWKRPDQLGRMETGSFWAVVCLLLFLFEAWRSRLGGERIRTRWNRHRSIVPSAEIRPQVTEAPFPKNDDPPERRSAFVKAKK